MTNPSSPKSNYRFIRIPVETAESVIGSLLEFPFYISQQAQHYWLRYSADNELCRAAALSIPAEHFSLHAEDYLVPNGAQIATERLPKLTWNSLRDFVKLRLPRVNLAGRLQAKQIAVWELHRGGKEQAAEAALYDAVALNQWLTTASAARVASLRFCTAAIAHDTVNARHDTSAIVFVVGKPLPPIPCQFLCKHGRIFIPAGYHWVPSLDSSIVEQSFGVQVDQWLLWTVDFGWTLLVENHCLPLSRASLRATLKEMSTSN